MKWGRRGVFGVPRNAEVTVGPAILSDEPLGQIRVYDPRVFRAGRRAFCRHWIETAARQPGVRKVRVDLATATGEIEFHPGRMTGDSMAEAFASSVRESLAETPESEQAKASWFRSPGSHWVALTAYPRTEVPSVWEVIERSADHVRIRHSGLTESRRRRHEYSAEMATADGVSSCRPGRISDALTIVFDPTQTCESRLLDASQAAWEDGEAVEPVFHPLLAATRFGRAINLVKAGGCFAFSVVGVLVPGVPTLPFLMATSYYLARSSPRLNARLLNSSLFGPVLREWETYHALSRASKRRMILTTFAVIVFTLVVAPFGPASLVPVLVVSSISIYAITRLPSIPSREEGRLAMKSVPALAF